MFRLKHHLHTRLRDETSTRYKVCAVEAKISGKYISLANKLSHLRVCTTRVCVD